MEPKGPWALALGHRWTLFYLFEVEDNKLTNPKGWKTSQFYQPVGGENLTVLPVKTLQFLQQDFTVL